MFCPRCGANNEPNQRFCYNCGSRLESAAQEQPTPAAQVPVIAPPTIAPAPPPYEPVLPVPTSPVYSNAGSYPPVLQNSGMAIASMVCGILSWVGLLPVIGAFAAIILGHMSRSEIRRSSGQLGGGGMALAGLIMGYAQIVLVALLACIAIVVFVGIGVGTS